MPAFADLFHPEKGDLMYGSNGVRTKYWSKLSKFVQEMLGAFNSWDLKSWQPDKKTNPGAWYCVDYYNNYFGVSGQFFFTSEFGGEYVFIGSKKEYQPHIISTLPKTIKEPETPQGKQELEQRNYYEKLLSTSRFSPDKAIEKAKVNPLKGNLKKDERSGSSEDQTLARIKNKSIRQACKFGIGMVCKELGGPFPEAKIHFLLDGLNLKRIAQKDLRVNGTSEEHFASITSSELRYVYRNWGKLKSTVNFYVNFNQVEAPWDEDWTLIDCKGKTLEASKASWGAYAERRNQKYEGNIPDKTLV